MWFNGFCGSMAFCGSKDFCDLMEGSMKGSRAEKGFFEEKRLFVVKRKQVARGGGCNKSGGLESGCGGGRTKGLGFDLEEIGGERVGEERDRFKEGLGVGTGVRHESKVPRDLESEVPMVERALSIIISSVFKTAVGTEAAASTTFFL